MSIVDTIQKLTIQVNALMRGIHANFVLVERVDLQALLDEVKSYKAPETSNAPTHVVNLVQDYPVPTPEELAQRETKYQEGLNHFRKSLENTKLRGTGMTELKAPKVCINHQYIRNPQYIPDKLGELYFDTCVNCGHVKSDPEFKMDRRESK